MTTKTFNARITNKRDTSANWTSNNPVLLNGEIIIVDTEAGQVRYKVGNGTSTYTQLPFTDESLITNINGKLSLSGGTMTGNIDMGGHKLTGLGAPTNPNDAVRQTDLKVVSDEVDGIISGTTGITLAPATTTKIGGVIVGDGIEVEADGTISVTPGLTQSEADERYLQLTGGTLTGEVDMGQNLIRNVSTIFGGAGFTIRSSGGTNVNAFILNISTSEGTIISGGLTSSSIDATNITVSNVGSGDTAVPNKAYVDSKSPTSVPVTLTTSGWSSNTQTVTVSGVSASETAQLITPVPAIASQSAYYEAGIMCTGQAANSLTFTCQTVPTSNLTVYVVIQPLS